MVYGSSAAMGPRGPAPAAAAAATTTATAARAVLLLAGLCGAVLLAAVARTQDFGSARKIADADFDSLEDPAIDNVVVSDVSHATSPMAREWEVYHDTQFEPQAGGDYTVEFQHASADSCAARATDAGLAMWVLTPDKTCSISRRLPAGDGNKKPGWVSGKSKWHPNFESVGMLSHSSWGVAESSVVRFKGKTFVMESVSGKNPPGPSSELMSAFRIRDLDSGRIVANVPEANGHAFFTASVDHTRGVAWVYGSARHRGTGNDGPCDSQAFNDPKHLKAGGCYVGAWKSTDMVNWSQTKKAFSVPKGEFRP